MSSKAILLINLGSPDSPKVSDVRKYLNEFLMDERVIDMPYLSRLLLVKGIITPLRAPKSALKYKSVWTDKGSPLINITKNLTELVGDHEGIPAFYSMRYGNPSTRDIMKEINRQFPALEELIVFPLYPHYAMSSYETAVRQVESEHFRGSYPFRLNIISPFYDHASYIHALTQSINPYLENGYDHVLFSYHGLPERHVKKTDPTLSHCLMRPDCCEVDSPAHAFCYRHQIKKTTDEVASKLKIPTGKYSFSFQSRLGRDKWFQPFTFERLTKMPGEGIEKLVVICPAFVADCLETLEEIWVEGKEIFLESGGKEFIVVPCLNENPEWVKSISEIINTN